MIEIKLIEVSEYERVRASSIGTFDKLALLANMSRANTLASVKRAGSGHLGSSFSAMDIVTLLYYKEMNTVSAGIESRDRDVYFSSKGHDVPGQYAVLFSLGILPREKFVKLRRLGGTYGHPDVSTPGMEANTGSLGMGIAKGKGFAFAKRLRGDGGRVFVMTGDGELQEGQIYESLQSAVNQKLTNITVIVDHNKLQSDKPVEEISDLGDIEGKFRAFGWHVERCDGHDFEQLDKVFSSFREVTDKPKVLIADTLKGRGVSFMEHPTALKAGGGYYRWHAGAPDDQWFTAAYEELISKINRSLEEFRLAPLKLEDYPADEKQASGVSKEFVVDAYGAALADVAAKRDDLIVLGADLTADCRLRAFEKNFPDRFIENGIAEQDMVSMAGGLALEGFLPVVNTFASFLSARANEQIYNNACEQTRIIYACHYAGLIPAGPGQSHQSIRDISLLGSLPNFVIVQPCNAAETHLVVDYAVNRCNDNCVLRLNIGPSPRIIELPSDYHLVEGRGVTLVDGGDAILFGYGPVMLNEALVAAQLLNDKGFHLKVVNMPWLNRVDNEWMIDTIGEMKQIFVVEDHAPVGGLGDTLLNAGNQIGLWTNKTFRKFAVEGYPACGTPPEALNYHGLDGSSLATRILQYSDENFRK
ncbi:MAG TPA: transketolase C-terminal domain-containing protein [Pyrinomonadaceae bacterium]|nr:transketolase C-terminal domain-containing protein [Pyrinomonadaceae bacterium]